jgi:hypothetical protein
MKTWFWYAICLYVWTCTLLSLEQLDRFYSYSIQALLVLGLFLVNMNISIPEAGKGPSDGPCNTKYKFSCKQLHIIVIKFQ